MTRFGPQRDRRPFDLRECPASAMPPDDPLAFFVGLCRALPIGSAMWLLIWAAGYLVWRFA